MRLSSRLAFGLLAVGFVCAIAALAGKAVRPGSRGTVVLAPGESVELEDSTLVLHDFRVPKYATGKPRQFVSDVRLLDVGSTQAVHAVISVNHPLRWKGHWLYQFGYDAQNEGWTELLAVRDQWLPLAALGGALLVLGAFALVFVPFVPHGVPSRMRVSRSLMWGAAVLVVAVPIVIIARAVFRPDPVPALQSPFLAPHVAAYAASYLIFLFAAFGFFRRLMPVGFLLMTLGLVLGAFWGKVCWGDFWQYDPKEMASLVTWLVYVAYFAFRHTHAEFALRVLGGASVLFTLLCVNYLRYFSGLHTYVR